MPAQVKKKKKLSKRIQLSVLIGLLKSFFTIEKYLLTIKKINYPKDPFILSMWHRHQCMINGVEDKDKFYVLISASNDGEMIAKAIECLDLKSIRGSSKRHGASAALSIIDKLKEGNSVAIMVDGPRGPVGKVKDGVVNISKLSGVPITPVAWASKDKTFLTFNSWDKFQLPFGKCYTIALFGDPIYIPEDADKEEMQKWCIKVEEAMNALQKDLEENFDKYKDM